MPWSTWCAGRENLETLEGKQDLLKSIRGGKKKGRNSQTAKKSKKKSQQKKRIKIGWAAKRGGDGRDSRS